MEFEAWYKTGRSVTAEFDKANAAEDLPHISAAIAFDGLAALIKDYAEPLTADMTVDSIGDYGIPDSEDPAHDTWVLRRSGLPDRLETSPMFGEIRVSIVERLDTPTFLTWIGRAVDQPAPVAGSHVDWSGIWLNRFAVRLPPEADDIRDGALYVRYDRYGKVGYTRAPVEIRPDGTTWVYVPDVHDNAARPFTVSLSNDEDSRIRLKLTLGWSVWNEPGSPGYRDVAAGLDRLTALSWAITSNHVLNPLA